MKVKYIAVVMSLFVVALPSYAAGSSQKHTSEITSKIKSPPVESPPVTGKININKVDVAVLTGSFKGIGKKRAQAIIAYRESHNGFKSLEEFAEIKGFGQRFVDKNREKLNEVFVLK